MRQMAQVVVFIRVLFRLAAARGLYTMGTVDTARLINFSTGSARLAGCVESRNMRPETTPITMSYGRIEDIGDAVMREYALTDVARVYVDSSDKKPYYAAASDYGWYGQVGSAGKRAWHITNYDLQCAVARHFNRTVDDVEIAEAAASRAAAARGAI